MTIEKLPSGSYRIRQTHNGKRYSVTVDTKPTQAQALQIIAQTFSFEEKKSNMSFNEAAKKYLKVKSEVLSPSTIASYEAYLRAVPGDFQRMNIFLITSMDAQEAINSIADEHSAKYVKNIYGFISAVLRLNCPSKHISCTLPKGTPKTPYIPTDADVKVILDEAKGTMHEIAVILACYGLRRSEICAITGADVNGDILTINKALVRDKDNNWIIKHTTKNDSSTRQIAIPKDVAAKIKRQGYAFNGFPNATTDWLYGICRKNGIPEFSIHKLRHYFCSKMSALGIDEATILAMGGWVGNSDVMKRVYRHTQVRDKVQKRETSAKLAAELF